MFLLATSFGSEGLTRTCCTYLVCLGANADDVDVMTGDKPVADVVTTVIGLATCNKKLITHYLRHVIRVSRLMGPTLSVVPEAPVI